MKKIIAAVSITCALGFAAALADSNDMSTTTDSRSTTTTQQAGTAPDSASTGTVSGTGDNSMNGNTTNPSTSGNTASTTTTTTTQKHSTQYWKNAKTCTDENGVTIHRGKTGFKACIDKMKQNENKEMSGMAPKSSSDADMNSDSAHTDDSTDTKPSY